MAELKWYYIFLAVLVVAFQVPKSIEAWKAPPKVEPDPEVLKLKKEAIEKGYAHWDTSSYGATTFKWNEPAKEVK